MHVASCDLTLLLGSGRSAAVLKAGGGAAVKEHSVAGRTELDMREKEKRCRRSGGFIDRRVIVHRSADRGAVRLCTFCLFSVLLSLLLLLVSAAVSAVNGAAFGFTGRPPDIPQRVSLLLFIYLNNACVISETVERHLCSVLQLLVCCCATSQSNE